MSSSRNACDKTRRSSSSRSRYGAKCMTSEAPSALNQPSEAHARQGHHVLGLVLGELEIELVSAHSTDEMSVSAYGALPMYSVVAGVASHAGARHNVGTDLAGTNGPCSWQVLVQSASTV